MYIYIYKFTHFLDAQVHFVYHVVVTLERHIFLSIYIYIYICMHVYLYVYKTLQSIPTVTW